MDFQNLKDLMSVIEEEENLSTVIFGCGCGCGGDYYTGEDWDEIHDEAEEARQELKKIRYYF